MKIILASASPRRHDLLQQAGVAFESFPANVPEDALPGEEPAAHVLRLARAKAMTVARGHTDRVVLGADTVVVLGRLIYGKPASPAAAREMLRSLSGVVHEVLTGVCLLRLHPAGEEAWVSRTRVEFLPLTADVIERYCQEVDTLDKAGAYAIQEHGDMIVKAIDGPLSNVIGLPVEDVVERLPAFADASGKHGACGHGKQSPQPAAARVRRG